MTNRQSTCVSMAVSYALTSMDVTGALATVFNTYFPTVSCGAAAAADAAALSDVNATTGARRRMHESSSSSSSTSSSSSSSSSGGGVGAPTLAREQERRRELFASSRRRESVWDDLPPPQPDFGDRRHLKSTTKSQAGETEAVDEAIPPMEVIEFAGLFVIWCCVTVSLVFWQTCGTHWRVRLRALCQGKKGAMTTDIKDLRQEMQDPDVPKFVNMDNGALC